MSSKAGRILKVIGIAISSIVLLAVLVIWFVFNSDRAARWIIGRVAASGTLSAARVHGDLDGPLALAGVRVHTTSADLAIDSVVFDWAPFGLLHKEVRFDSLHIVGMDITIPDSTPTTSGPPKRPSLPIKVLLKNALVRDLSVHAPGGVEIVNGSGTVDGTADNYHLAATLALLLPQFDSIPALDTLPLAVTGQGSLVQMRLGPATARLLDGELRASGTLTWWPIVSWNLALRGEHLRPGLMAPEPRSWPGLIALQGATDGTHDSTGTRGRVAIDSLSGALRNVALEGRGAIRLLGNSPDSTTAIGIPSLRVRWGSADLSASGYAGDTLALNVQSTIGQLRDFFAGVSGQVMVAGSVTGARKRPRVTGTFSGNHLAQGTNRLRAVRGNADFVLAPDGRTNLELRGRDASAGAVHLTTLMARVTGARPSHRVALHGSGSNSSADLVLRGAVREQRWSGSIDTLNLTDPIIGSWRLTEPAPLGLSADADTLGRLCLRSSDSVAAQLCASGGWRSIHNWHLAGHLDRFPLAVADSFLPDSLLGAREGLAGTLSAQLEASASAGELRARLGVHTSGAAFLYPLTPSDTTLQQVAFDTAAIDLRAGRDGVEGSATLRFVAADRSPVGRLDGFFALPGYHNLSEPLRTQAIRFQINGQIDNLSIARAFTRQLDSLTGRITFTARGGGQVRAPEVRSELRIDQLAAWLGEDRVARGSVDAILAGSVSAGRAIRGSVTVAPRGVVYEYPIAGVQQQIALDSGQLRITAGDSGVQGQMALAMADSVGTRLGRITADLALPQYTRLGMPLGSQPVSLHFNTELDRMTVLQALTTAFDSLAGQLSLGFAIEGTPSRPRIDGKLRVRNLRALLPQGARITGGVDGDLDFTTAPDSTIAAKLRLIPVDLAIGSADRSVRQIVTLADTGLAAQIGPDGTHGTLDLHFTSTTAGPVGELIGRLSIPGYSRLGQPLSPEPLRAELNGEIRDLGFLAGFTEQIDSLSGSARINLAVSGTAGDPRAAGRLAVDSAAASLPLLGVVYHDVQFHAQTDSGGRIAFAGRLRSGPGHLELRGATPLRPTVQQPAQLHIEGRRFEAMDTPEVHAIITPTIDAIIAGDSINARGEVVLPEVAVHLTEIPEHAVPPSGDVVFVGDSVVPDAAAEAGWRVASNVQVILGDSVLFQGFNFTAQLGGRLLLRQSPERPPSASGLVVIQHGHYKAYGQDLTITEGQIRFAGGPVDDPTLAIEATRTARDSVVAGLRITGTFKDPQVDIFSTPAMPQDRALAYLVLGHAPGESSGSSGSLIDKAVNSLGLRGGNYLARTIGQGIGLGNAHLETEGGLQSASFVAGKYLSPNLYVSYGIGLFDPISTLRIQYDISKHWTLQAERGGTTGADILFQTERGSLTTTPPSTADSPD